MQIDVAGQVVLVTGGTKGVGRGIAEAFADAGASVVVSARSKPDDLPESWGFLSADLRNGDAAWQMVDDVVAEHGRIDTVVNNAGGAPPADTAEAPVRFTEKIIALNLLSAIYVAQRANHHMQQGDGGSIINISSVTAQRPAPTVAAYGAAKAGLNNYTETSGHEWAPKVRVNSVTCGSILTEQAELHYGDGEAMRRINATIPMGRMALPADVAAMCLFLASPMSGYLTGSDITLDGGGDRPAFLVALDSLAADSDT